MISPWWVLKVGCGLALVVHGVLGATGAVPVRRIVSVDVLVAQSLVFLGTAIHVTHYVILKRVVGGRLDEPGHLVVRGGLFGRVRHPMYLGDALAYAGLALLAGDVVSLGAAAVGTAALRVQCALEDRALATRFGEAFRRWQARTGALVPLA